MKTPGPWVQMNDHVRRRTIALGERLHQIYVILQPGARLPEHTHVHEQIATCVRGRLRLIVAGKAVEAGPGESIHLPSNIPHSAEVDEETHVIDTFSPPREDMLEKDRAAAG